MEYNCPSCGNEVENWEQVQYCPFCGAPLEKSTVHGESEKYAPWDDRENIGFFRALVDTWKQSVFHPTEFFATMPLEGGYGGPLLYGFIVGEIAVLFSLFWESILLMMGALGESYGQFEEMGFSMGVILLIALASPVLVIVGYFISAGILHLCLLIVGGARRDFEATFRVVCYAAGANMFGVIPFCGGLVAWLWNAALNIIGIREAHKISSGRAVLAYCLPAVVCCGFLALAMMFAWPNVSEWFEGWAP